MDSLLSLLAGWLGLLSRGSVLLQLLVVSVALLLYRSALLRLRVPRSSWRRLALRRVQPPAAVEAYWQRAVLPLYLVLALVVLVDRIEGLQPVGSIPLLRMFGQSFTLGGLVLLVLLPYFLVVLSELPVFLAGGAMERLAGMGAGNRKAFELLLRYAVIGVGLLWLANQLGLNSTAVAAIAGGLSVGLGFGIKEVFSNFVSGLWLLFEGSVRPGDVLVYEGDPCQVRKLGLRAATLWRDSDNAELLVPNQTFFTATTTTYSGTDSLRCARVVIGAAYRHDPDDVVRVILETVRAQPRVLAEPEPYAFAWNFADSAIEYVVFYWIHDPMSNATIAGEVRRALWHAFRDHGIEIPRPQRVVQQLPPPPI
jgi:small-conductance mechanosensitive channel